MVGKSGGLSEVRLWGNVAPEALTVTLSEPALLDDAPLWGRGFDRSGTEWISSVGRNKGSSKKNVDPQPRPREETPMLP
jgi:hypothetical protein